MKLLKGDLLTLEYSIAVKEPETVSHFLGNFNYKTTRMLRKVNFRLFRKLLQIKQLPAITMSIFSLSLTNAGKIIRSARQAVLKLPEQYAHHSIFSQI